MVKRRVQGKGLGSNNTDGIGPYEKTGQAKKQQVTEKLKGFRRRSYTTRGATAPA